MARAPSLARSLAPLALLALTSGCATSGAVKAADAGDYPLLKRHLADDLAKNRIDGGRARDMARAVARHEVRSAKAEEAVARLDQVRACLERVDDVVGERAKTRDDAGAHAAFLLVDAHLVSLGKWRKEERAEDGAWRAVGARSLVDRSDGGRRRELFLDLDARVRQSALAAAQEAADVGDAETLLETVRLDPDEKAQGLAARASGTLGGMTIVLALKDRWGKASEPVRTAIIDAWASKASYATGGREQLFWAAETEHGMPAITAGVALVARGGDDAVIGRGALVRAMSDGGGTARLTAINLANLGDPDQKAAVQKAAELPDEALKVAALSKLTLDKEGRAAALEELGKIAAGTGDHRNAARSALALAGDRRVVSLLVGDMSSSEPGVRAWAAGELARMKEFPQASQVLADEDASVRTRAACAILAVKR